MGAPPWCCPSLFVPAHEVESTVESHMHPMHKWLREPPLVLQIPFLPLFFSFFLSSPTFTFSLGETGSSAGPLGTIEALVEAPAWRQSLHGPAGQQTEVTRWPCPNSQIMMLVFLGETTSAKQKGSVVTLFLLRYKCC